MDPEEYLRFHSVPELRRPTLVAAFAGWNDAGQCATFALTSLVKSWTPSRLADVDPEEFYDFSTTRPTINLSSTHQRRLHWPTNRFFAHVNAAGEEDVVLLVGVEPQLRWRTFCDVVMHVAERVEASRLITLGGYLADVPHTIEPRLTGFATSAPLMGTLETLGVHSSSYEGPTGIVGAVHEAWSRTDRPAVSLWANVPHYISATPNPQMSLALLRKLESLLRADMPLESVQEQAAAFRAQIDEALHDNPEALEYVQQLENHFAGDPSPEPAPELFAELEEFLRTRRPSTEDEDDEE